MTIKQDSIAAKSRGLLSAFLSPTFLGFMPIFAKIAYSYDVDVYTVAALRTVIAAAVLWIIAIIVDTNYVYSSQPAIAGSFIAGAINGLGSLFFYSSLTRIDASMGQLINITYLIYVTLLLRIMGHHISKLTVARTMMAILAIYIITSSGLGQPDWIGVLYMAIAAFSYAIQIVFSQRIMRDVPAMTMALYALSGMSTVVVIAWFVVTPPINHIPAIGWGAVIAMGVVTALARLTLFLGVKNLGGMQTSLIGVAEVLVSIVLAYWLLDEFMTLWQWAGATLLTISILLVKFEKDVPSFDGMKTLLIRLTPLFLALPKPKENKFRPFINRQQRKKKPNKPVPEKKRPQTDESKIPQEPSVAEAQ